MSDFKTQTEIWQWLLDGGRIQEAYQDHPFELKDGFVVDASGERWHLIFRYPTQWYKVKPKVKYLKSIKQILEENPDYYFDREGNIRNSEDVGRIICYSDLNRVIKYSTGIKVQLPKGYAGLILARSSIYKQGPWVLANSVGLLDVDFQGELKVLFKCVSDDWDLNDFPYELGDRIAQLMITPFVDIDWEPVEKFEKKTIRNKGGVGSTGR